MRIFTFPASLGFYLNVTRCQLKVESQSSQDLLEALSGSSIDSGIVVSLINTKPLIGMLDYIT